MAKKSRVLLAQSVDWLNTARMPAMLARAGVECDLVDPGDTHASSSSHVRRRESVPDGLEAVAREVLRVASDYDRVVMCDEDLIREVMRVGGADADAILPGTRAGVDALCDKTLFPAMAQAGGLRVPAFEVVEDADEAARAAERIGGSVAVKRRWGAGGAGVRIADSPEAASQAAVALGGPVVVEAFIEGVLVNTPCLYHQGKLVAAMASRKLELQRPNGPSTVNAFLAIDDRLLEFCERSGEVFGLSGFASADAFLVDDGQPVVLEVNPRPVPQLHLGTSLGVDVGRAFADVLSGGWDGAPRVASRSRTVRLFPQYLIRRRAASGPRRGTIAWATSRGALADVPWEDLGLLRHHVREFTARSS